MSPFRHALVLGKFYPPHNGHHHLVRTAAQASERTTVAVLASSVESIPLQDRVAWLAAEHAHDQGVAVVGDYDEHRVDFADDAIWRAHVDITRSVLARRAIADGDPAGAPVDAVFSSEKYGDELAARLGATHVPVDPARTRHQVSGTAIRADPAAHWHFLAPATRQGLAARIVVVGAESTGTTTVSKLLAERHNAAWVPEYGRQRTEDKLTAARALAAVAGEEEPTLERLTWTVGDFVDVARQQTVLADDAARDGGPIVVCDNDSWAATIWCERYLGADHPDVRAEIGPRRPALYLLTDHVGVPFEQDGWRDGEHVREAMTVRFEQALAERGVPWLKLSGRLEDRLAEASRACEAAVRRHFTYADPLS